MIRHLYTVTTFTLALTLAAGAAGQVPSGTPEFGSFTSGPDVIDLANLNVQLTVPVMNKPGRGTNFGYNLNYNSSVWYPVTSGSTKAWQPVSAWGWQGMQPAGESELSYNVVYSASNCYDGVLEPMYTWLFQNFVYTDASGVQHAFSEGYDYIQSPGGPDCPVTGPQPNPTPPLVAEDGSGLTLYLTLGEGYLSAYLKDINGNIIYPTIDSNPSGSQGSVSSTDRNGNEITSNNGQYTDTLGFNVLGVVGTAPSATNLSYTSPSGATSTYAVTYKSYTVKTNFGCSGVSEYGPTAANLVDKVTLPDGTYYQFAYENTPGFSGDVTGRPASVILPTGGTISYSYTAGTDGHLITCSDGSTAGMERSTPDTGSNYWAFTRVPGSGAASTTTVTDPQGNQTVIQFQGIYETERQAYQGTTSGTLLESIYTCYGVAAPCNSTAVSSGFTARTVNVQLGSGGPEAEHDETYLTPGVLSETQDYDYGSAPRGALLRSVVYTYPGTGDPELAPTEIQVYNGSNQLVSTTQYNLDEYALVATSGTPQYSAPLGPRGNITTITYPVSGLAEHYTYYDNGTVATHTDVNGAVTTYQYSSSGSSCGNSFPTSVSEPLSLSKSITWNCTGGVLTGITDENGNSTTASYTDSYFWRPGLITAPTAAATHLYYTGQTSYESALTFNSGNSISDTVVTADSQGRVHVSQTRQTPSATTFDSVETDYDFAGRPSRTTIPYSAAQGVTNASASGTTITFDALGRPLTSTDSGGGTTTYTYSKNDVLITVGPAPSGENTKRRQLEYNALGQLTSVCELTGGTSNWPSGTCGQQTAQTGYWTKYSYDALANLLTVTQNAQSSSNQQTRSMSYDALGRLTQETLPESGTTVNTYDSDPSGVCFGTSPGNLVKTVDAVGNVTCMTYDSLHRMLSATAVSGPYGSATPTRKYVYDAATVNGTAMQNVKGQLAEAYTCNGSCTSKLTDIFFTTFPETSGGVDTGRVMVQMYESTPHSGGYHRVQDIYYANGTLGSVSASLNGAFFGVPAVHYAVDGEGRLKTATDTTNSVSLETATSYNNASLPTGVTLGNGDTDTYSYDPKTNRPTQYKFSISGTSAFTVTGTLTWNANWSLASHVLADTNDSSKNQNCTYSADDISRISAVNCSAAWAQTFLYDPFGNIKKDATAGISYLAGYNPSTNRVNSGVTASYDANGNMLANSWASFSWNATGQPSVVNGINATYDALGRLAELQTGSTYTEFIYRPSGDKLATMNGSTLLKAVFVLPGGGSAVYNSAGLNFIRHKDWLGSSRLATTWAHAVYSKEAYAPFGETYNEAGTADRSFTGQDQDTTQGIYDYYFRRYDSTAGRWLSPDPAALGSVNLAYPQSWDAYAYVQNQPLSLVDAKGLDCVYLNGDGDSVESVDHDSSAGECWANGGYWAPGYVPFSNNYIGFDPNSDMINIQSFYNGAFVGSDANCLECSTLSPLGTFLGAFTQTFGGYSVPTYGEFSFNMTWNQFLGMMRSAGFNYSSADTILGSVGLGHTGINMRDSNWACSTHVVINWGSQYNDGPITGTFHVDLYNPTQGFLIEHAATDVAVNLLNGAGAGITSPNSLCAQN